MAQFGNQHEPSPAQDQKSLATGSHHCHDQLGEMPFLEKTPDGMLSTAVAAFTGM